MPIQTYLQNLFCHTRELLFGSHLSRRMAINHFFFWSLSRENLCPPRPEHPGTTHNPGISVEFNHNNGNYTTNNVASLCTARKPEVPCRYCAPYRIDRRRGSSFFCVAVRCCSQSARRRRRFCDDVIVTYNFSVYLRFRRFVSIYTVFIMNDPIKNLSGQDIENLIELYTKCTGWSVVCGTSQMLTI